MKGPGGVTLLLVYACGHRGSKESTLDTGQDQLQFRWAKMRPCPDCVRVDALNAFTRQFGPISQFGTDIDPWPTP